MVVIAALSACFKPGEDYLSLEQILVRGFAPTQPYGKKWIADFVARRVIEAKLLTSPFPNDSISKTLLLKRPAGLSDNQDDFQFHISKKVHRLINSDFQYSLYLKELALDISACECIEYASYYADKSKVTVFNESHTNSRLKLLLLECQQEQVFMLIWRAIKHIVKEGFLKNESIDFVEIMDNAMTSYLKYKRGGIEIQCYSRPKCLDYSALAKHVEFLNREKEKMF